MKILLAVDGSKFSQAAIDEVIQRSWPPHTEVRILSVVHPFPFPLLPDPFNVGAACYYDSLKEERKRASRDIEDAERQIREKAPHLTVASERLEGSPKKMIVEEAERWGADLIIVGTHGQGGVTRFPLGSVAQAVVAHAPCSVEVVRHLQAA